MRAVLCTAFGSIKALNLTEAAKKHLCLHRPEKRNLLREFSPPRPATGMLRTADEIWDIPGAGRAMEMRFL